MLFPSTLTKFHTLQIYYYCWIYPHFCKMLYTDLKHQFRSSYYPFFGRCWNGVNLSKSLFWNERTQRAHSRWQLQSYLTSTSINFISIIFSKWYYSNSIVIGNQIKFYVAINRGNFLCRFTISFDGLLLTEQHGTQWN